MSGLIVVQLPQRPDSPADARMLADRVGRVLHMGSGGFWLLRVRQRVTGPWEVSLQPTPTPLGVYLCSKRGRP